MNIIKTGVAHLNWTSRVGFWALDKAETALLALFLCSIMSMPAPELTSSYDDDCFSICSEPTEVPDIEIIPTVYSALTLLPLAHGLDIQEVDGEFYLVARPHNPLVLQALSYYAIAKSSRSPWFQLVSVELVTRNYLWVKMSSGDVLVIPKRYWKDHPLPIIKEEVLLHRSLREIFRSFF